MEESIVTMENIVNDLANQSIEVRTRFLRLLCQRIRPGELIIDNSAMHGSFARLAESLKPPGEVVI